MIGGDRSKYYQKYHKNEQQQHHTTQRTKSTFTMAKKRKKHAGKGAECSILTRFLHPRVDHEDKTHRSRVVLISQEEIRVNRKPQSCFTCKLKHSNVVYHAVKSHFKVERSDSEGKDGIELSVKPICEDDSDVTLPSDGFSVKRMHGGGEMEDFYLVFYVCRDDVRPTRRGKGETPAEPAMSKAKMKILESARRRAPRDQGDEAMPDGVGS